MPTFEHGWICRNCWTSNRAQDGRCYRCKTDRPDYGEPVPLFSQKAAVAPTPEPEPAAAPRFAAVVAEPEPANVSAENACAGCAEPLLPDAKFCVRCGLSTAADAKPATRFAAPAPPVVAQAAAPPPTPVAPAPVAAASTDETAPARRFTIPHVEVPHVEIPRLSVPHVALPNPSAAAMRGGMRAILARFAASLAKLPPVVAVTRFAAAVTATWQRAVAFRRQRTEVWLFVGWLGLVATSTVLLFAYAGVGSGEVGGQLLNGLLVVLALSVLSALTAALTITLLKPMRSDMREMNERLKDLSRRVGQSGAVADRTDVVHPMRAREEAQRAS
jgi:hypothetical protein